MKILFLVKRSSEYGSYTSTSKSGLRNSAKFVVDAINKFACIGASLEFCIDGNDIDNKLFKIRPNICIIEALWVTPTKIRELVKLHPKVEFIIRIHSKTAFLAMEGVAVSWLKAYNNIENVSIAFNNIETSSEFKAIQIPNYYLPNIYSEVSPVESKWYHKLLKQFHCVELNKQVYRIGCFGAIRPFKNHLNQAIAAILFADAKKVRLKFYINAGRLEQGGENVLKNLRALFQGTRHELIELGWYTHEQFIEVINRMDCCVQVSYTESFNIVAADAVSQMVPVVVSQEIDWIKRGFVDPNDVQAIAQRIAYVIAFRDITTTNNLNYLHSFNQHSIDVWFKFLFA